MTNDSCEISAISAERLTTIIRDDVPFVGRLGVSVVELAAGYAHLRLAFSDQLLRPGGTIAGPALFGLADVALFGAVMSKIGEVPLAVTVDMSISFLRKPDPAPVDAVCDLLKLGRRLAYGTVTLTSVGDPRPVAHATGHYAIPSDRVGEVKKGG